MFPFPLRPFASGAIHPIRSDFLGRMSFLEFITV